MRASLRIAIVGAGLAGLSCAQELARGGLSPVLFDKGRGLGGRLSTRRRDGGFQFDHGAQYLTATSDAFLSMLKTAEAAGAAARWPGDRPDPAFVGTPGMSGLAKHIAAGLTIRTGTRITGISEEPKGWRLTWDGGAETFDRVVVTAPAPQTAALLPETFPALDAVRMAPCLAMMLGWPDRIDLPFLQLRDPNDALSWLAVDSSKPGRPGTTCVVAHATEAWSARHLERGMDQIAEDMAPLVADILGTPLMTRATYRDAHRWRYALVTHPLGMPFLSNPARSLFAGGDWCLGPRAEDAWTAGRKIAEALTEAVVD